MYNYYINEELSQSYPKNNPRKFRYGETHYIKIVDDKEDKSTRVENTTDVKEYTNYDYKVKRMVAYGPVESQLEYITENGLDAWQEKVSDIKKRYPKNIKDTVKRPKRLR